MLEGLFEVNVENMENRFMSIIILEIGLILYLISGGFYLVILYFIELVVK